MEQAQQQRGIFHYAELAQRLRVALEADVVLEDLQAPVTEALRGCVGVRGCVGAVMVGRRA